MYENPRDGTRPPCPPLPTPMRASVMICVGHLDVGNVYKLAFYVRISLN